MHFLHSTSFGMGPPQQRLSRRPHASHMGGIFSIEPKLLLSCQRIIELLCQFSTLLERFVEACSLQETNKKTYQCFSGFMLSPSRLETPKAKMAGRKGFSVFPLPVEITSSSHMKCTPCIHCWNGKGKSTYIEMGLFRHCTAIEACCAGWCCQ